MESKQFILTMIIICIIFISSLIFINPFKLIFKLLFNSISGILMLFGLNFLLISAGLSISLNFFTLFIISILGIPGLLLMYTTLYIFK